MGPEPESSLNIHKYLVSEPFLEAVPQVHILLVIWVLDGGYGCHSAVQAGPHFITTFVTSVITASFGISKFLKSGPCRFIRSDTCLMGFGTLSYILLFLNIAATVVVKGLIVFYSTKDHPGRSGGLHYLEFISCYSGQLVMVSM